MNQLQCMKVSNSKVDSKLSFWSMWLCRCYINDSV